MSLRLPATFSGRVVPGAGRGTSLGFPTANLAIAVPLPAEQWGVYACWVRHKGRTHPGVAHVGPAATFGERDAGLEIHLLDWSGTLQGETLDVELVAYIRGTRKFPDPAELVAEMRQDAATATRHLQPTR